MPIPYQNQRNIQDRVWTSASFALPAAASTATTQATPAFFDLGTDPYKAEELDAVLSFGALNSTMVPNGTLFSARLQTSNTSDFAVLVHQMDKNFVGAGGAGVAASDAHFRLPPDCPRYIRLQAVLGSGTATAAAVNATASLRF